MATLTFLKYLRVIQVDAPQIEVTIQDLVNQIRMYEHQLINLDYGHICNAYGKQPLGGGSFVGITLELINNWRIQFEARLGTDTILCTVSGGNLVAINEYANNPIKPSAFTQVVIAQSSSPTIIQAESDYGMLYLIESLRGRNKSIGSIFYWNPAVIDDTGAGTTPATAVKTFSHAHTLATAGANDIIFALSTASGGVTTVTETIAISKANVKLRGPGFAFQLAPTTAGSPTVNIAADNVEVSGFYVTTAAGGTDNGITIVTGSNDTLVQDCWIEGATGNGIDISGASRTQIDTCAIENCTGNGIKINDATTLTSIKQCIVSGNGTPTVTSDGVDISGSSSADNIFENNLIYNNTGYGIDIGNNVTRTGVRLHHTFSGNTLGETNDLGAGSFIETTSTPPSAGQIADAIWDEIIANPSHTTTGSAAKILKDTKTKATLASLK